jgi:hypothetical protein
LLFQLSSHAVVFDETVTERVGLVRRDESSGATVNALATTRSFVKLTSTVTTINGAVAPASPNARTLLIFNATGAEVTINHESGSATAANRFTLPDSEAVQLADDSSASFIYDHGTSRWVQSSAGGLDIDGVDPGDMLVWDGSEFVVLPKGPDNYVPTYDSGEPLGITSFEATDQHGASTIAKRDASGDLELNNIRDSSGVRSVSPNGRTLRNSSDTALGSWSGTYFSVPGINIAGATSGSLNILAHPTLGSEKTITLPDLPCAANSWWKDNGSGTYTCETNAPTATALAANPSDCSSNEFASAIAANGNLTCSSIPNAATTATSSNTNSAIVARDGSGNFSAGTITAALSGNASTATALAANPTACGAGDFVTDIAADGTLTCDTPSGGGGTSRIFGFQVSSAGAVCSSSPCTVSNQVDNDGNTDTISGVTWSGAGSMTANITSGRCSTIPACGFTAETSTARESRLAALSTTSFLIGTYNSGGTDTNSVFSLICTCDK